MIYGQMTTNIVEIVLVPKVISEIFSDHQNRQRERYWTVDKSE